MAALMRGLHVHHAPTHDAPDITCCEARGAVLPDDQGKTAPIVVAEPITAVTAAGAVT